VWELERTHAQARSQLAQAEAKVRSKEVSLNNRKKRLAQIVRDVESCTIRATRPGLVLYASSMNPGRYRSSEQPIQEGATVRYRQTIINLPNLATLAARVNIHETDVKQVHKGQPARITVEALRGETLAGRVAKVSPLASAEHRWLNPDVRVHATDVAIDNPPPDLKPGMTATAEIIVDELKNVLYVPVQAVTTRDGRRACYVETGRSYEVRPIVTGHHTAKYIEILSGLTEGDVVCLSPPEGAAVDEKKAKKQGAAEEAEKRTGRRPRRNRPSAADAPRGRPRNQDAPRK